jgi:phosphatidylinositol-bisphosphatase
MIRYFPNGEMRILIVSWNMSSQSPPTDINDLLLPESITYVPDLYAIGIQEGPSNDMSEWQIQLQTTIGPSHVLFHSSTLGVLHLAIFLRRDLTWFCTIPEEAVFNIRPAAANLLKTKGALGISFAFFGSSFLFINSHLSAHQNKLKHRIEEYEKICQSFNLPKNLRPLNPRYVSKDVTARFDCVFWFGDLNFRLELSRKEVMDILDKAKNESNPSINSLIEKDQLTNTMKKGLAFSGFFESSSPQFPPTYKFKFGTNDYDTVSQRVPSYTDRILYRSKRPAHIHSLQYNWVPKMKTSDHKPVFSLFDVRLRPGRDYATRLNAGSFNRNVYIEALKKRITELDNDNKRGSSVCSLM